MSCEIFTKEELIQMLREAKNALHQIMLGDKVVEVKDQNGEVIKYDRANRNHLEDYIRQLELQIGCRKVVRPIEFYM